MRSIFDPVSVVGPNGAFEVHPTIECPLCGVTFLAEQANLHECKRRQSP